ncbi:formin-binding protein 1-like [Contarinia nasturtii]|uniref:formin-binding protein 1-like n=1 Tax=Contarinia nasturtii TaxID=265458 RepID=UPI0012D3C204|nr:formin-binding protein 1-like [Contarinia nasturtii]
MSWGTELWDQFENLASHTHKGIDFLDKYGAFVRDRCTIEMEYASKLRRLVKNYQPKKKEEEDYEFTSWQAFRNVLREIGDLAGQREVIAEQLQAQVINAITLLSKNLRDERKKALNDGSTYQQNLALQIGALERAKRNYEKSYRDAEKAVDSYQRADADLNLSRAEVEKQRHNMASKNQQSDDSKNEYANQLQKTNKLQQQHYEVAIPDVFNRLQEIDEKRTGGMKEFIKRSADVELSVAPIIARCLEGISKAAESIDEKEDSQKVVERYKSGFTPPQDIKFEDLSKMDPDSASPSEISSKVFNHHTLKSTISATKLKKRPGFFWMFNSNKNNLLTDGTKEDYSDLPPNQRRKKLTAKIQEIQQKIQSETAARDGLMKMKVVYEANSLLGDPMTVEGQLNESEHKLEKYKSELVKFQTYLEQANAMQHSPQSNRNQQNSQSTTRHSNGCNDDGEDQPDDGQSLSRSASENSVAQNNESINGSSASPESGLGTSHTSLHGSGQEGTNEQIINDDMYYEVEPLQPLGICKALYAFDATSEGSIPMAEGEELHVIELDQGDGWTRVRRITDNSGWEEGCEGFVPTSYIESTLYA